MTTAMLLVVSVIVIGWLTAASTAVRSVSRIWLRHWAEQGARGSSAVDRYLEKPQRLVLSAGTAMALAAVLTGLLLGTADTGGAWRDIGRVVLAALVLLVFGQLVPRAIGRRWAVPLLPYLIPALQVTDVVLGPLSLAVRGLALRTAKGSADAPEEPRDTLEDLLREGELEGVSAGDEAAIISGVVQFGDKTASDVMTPLEEIFAVDGALSREEVAQQVAQSGYSRVPVYEGSLDNPVGMVHVFDLIKAFAAGRPLTWRRLAFATPDSHCNDLLARMLRAQLHLALVRSADGRTLGLVTLEDLLEELVGDIRDEHDEPSPPPSTPGAPTTR
ncbi:MAG: CNNM domain-containing protein [Gemmatimonadaceae bacterium]